MKLSVSRPDDDVEFLDQYARAHARSRSGAVHVAIDTLRQIGLADAYEQAWEESGASGEARLWEQTVGDGLRDAARRDPQRRLRSGARL